MEPSLGFGLVGCSFSIENKRGVEGKQHRDIVRAAACPVLRRSQIEGKLPSVLSSGNIPP